MDNLTNTVFGRLGGFGKKMDLGFKRMKAYSTYKRFDSLEDLVKTSNQGKPLVEEDGKFYVVEGSKREEAFIPPHYKCPDCGIIKGKPSERLSTSTETLPSNIAYAFDTYCNICDNVLGHRYVPK